MTIIVEFLIGIIAMNPCAVFKGLTTMNFRASFASPQMSPTSSRSSSYLLSSFCCCFSSFVFAYCYEVIDFLFKVVVISSFTFNLVFKSTSNLLQKQPSARSLHSVGSTRSLVSSGSLVTQPDEPDAPSTGNNMDLRELFLNCVPFRFVSIRY
jgi:hypothetical protein